MKEIAVSFQPLFQMPGDRIVTKNIPALTSEEFPVSFIEKTISNKRVPMQKEFRIFHGDLYERSNVTQKHVLETLKYHVRSKADFEDPYCIVFYDDYLWRRKNREPVYIIKTVKNETKVGVTHIDRKEPKYLRNMFHSLAVQPIMRELGIPEDTDSSVVINQYFLSFIDVKMPNEITLDPAKGYLEEQIATEQKRIDKYQTAIKRASKQIAWNKEAEEAALARLKQLQKAIRQH